VFTQYSSILLNTFLKNTLRLRSEQRNLKEILQDWFPVEYFPLSAFGMKKTIARDSVGKASFLRFHGKQNIHPKPIFRVEAQGN
jgi:hypothetical protein